MSYVNDSKPSGSGTNDSAGGYTFWADTVVTWASPTISWTGFVPYTFDSEPSTLIDSYSETNVNAQRDMPRFSTNDTNVGQCFSVTNQSNLNSCSFFLKKAGSPLGNVYARLQAISGTFGTNAVPTGIVLATSNPLDVSTLTTASALYTFSFPNGFQMNASTNYAIYLHYTGSTNTSNAVEVGVDTSSPTHAGNAFTSTDQGVTWASNTFDVTFYVYGTAGSYSNDTEPT